MSFIHPTAVVDPQAKIGEEVTIGPYCVIGPEVTIGDHCQLLSSVVVNGKTKVGPHTSIYPFASIGHAPQDMKYRGEPSTLTIGAHTIIREQVTINPGTAGGGMATRVGDHCLLMVGAHVAHDCKVCDHVIMVNNATLAGHVTVDDYAIIGGLSAIHQFCRIGKHAMVGGMSGVESDVIPYGLVMGNRARLTGLNIVGLKRRGFSRNDVAALRRAYRLMFAEEGTMAERLDDVTESYGAQEAVMDILSFVRSASSRGICQPRAG